MIDHRASQGLFHRLGAVAGSPQTAGLIDQSIVSASNFTLTWMLARKLSVADYGLYVMLIGLILALNSIQSALIVFPFTVRYAGSDLQLWQSGVVHCLLVSLITLPVQLIVVIAGSFYLHHLPLSGIAILTLCLWQTQEIVRQAMFQRQLFSRAVMGDSVRYLIPALLVVFLPGRLLSAEHVLMFIAGSSAAAFFLCIDTFLAGNRGGISWHRMKREIRDSWSLGRSIILFNAFGSVLSQGSIWVLGNIRGLAAVSQYQAINNILGIPNPAVTGIGVVLNPAVARAASKSGSRAAIRQAVPYVAVMASLVAPVLGIFVLIPHWTLVRFYGPASPYSGLVFPLQIATVGQALFICSQVAATILACMNRAAIIWRIQLITSVTCLAAMIPAARWAALPGFLVIQTVFYGLGMVAMLWNLHTAYKGQPLAVESGQPLIVNA